MHSSSYSPTISPLALISAAIITYVVAEYLGGNGVLAVTVAGLFFGNVYIKHKRKLQEFSSTFAVFLEIIIFILIGMIIKIPLTSEFFASSFYIFLMYLIIRFITVELSFIKSAYTFKEKLFMTLNTPKGVAVAVVAFTLATISIIGMKPILDLILVFMIYTIVLSAIVTRLTPHFIKIEKVKEES